VPAVLSIALVRGIRYRVGMPLPARALFGLAAALVVSQAGFAFANTLRESAGGPSLMDKLGGIGKPNPITTLRAVEVEGESPLAAEHIAPLYRHLMGQDVNLKDLLELTRIIKRAAQIAGCPMQISVPLHKLDAQSGVVYLRIREVYSKHCPDVASLAHFDPRAVQPLQDVDVTPQPLDIAAP